MKEKELYNSVTAGIKNIVDEVKKEIVVLNVSDNFSCKLATIYDEVVAVRMSVFSKRCVIYIARNCNWLPKDVEYVGRIEKYLNISQKRVQYKEIFKGKDLHDVIMSHKT